MKCRKIKLQGQSVPVIRNSNTEGLFFISAQVPHGLVVLCAFQKELCKIAKIIPVTKKLIEIQQQVNGFLLINRSLGNLYLLEVFQHSAGLPVILCKGCTDCTSNGAKSKPIRNVLQLGEGCMLLSLHTFHSRFSL